eukprot:jgi/Bigna1/144903/aug1.92_g19611
MMKTNNGGGGNKAQGTEKRATAVNVNIFTFKRALKMMQGHKDKLPPKLHASWTGALIVIWYLFAIVGTIASKRFIKRSPKPMTLAGGQMFIGGMLDIILLLGCGFSNLIKPRIFLAAMPVGITLTLGRFLTYFSYQSVAASLTHTVKASSPVFTVILLFIFYGKCQPLTTLLSLFPIILGVVLSAVTEMEIKADGFAAAVFAGLISTIQSLYAKRALRNTSFHPMVFHMCSCLWAAIFLIPSSFFLEGEPSVLFNSTAATLSTIGDSIEEETAGMSSFVIFASFFCYWGQNLSSILVLSQMHVANVSRRFVLIICTMIYFGSSITVTKMVGILLALSGFFWFGFSKKKKVTTANEPSTVVTTRIPSPKALGATDYNQNTSHTLEMVKIEAI